MTARWEPYKRADGPLVEVGAREDLWWGERRVVARVKPKGRRVEKAWRKAERVANEANAALDAVEDSP